MLKCVNMYVYTCAHALVFPEGFCSVSHEENDAKTCLCFTGLKVERDLRVLSPKQATKTFHDEGKSSKNSRVKQIKGKVT